MQLTQINNDKTLLYLSLARITFLSFREKQILEKNLDSFNQLALMSIDDISAVINRKIKKDKWNGEENLRFAKLAKNYCESLKISIIHNEDIAYPELLRQISDPPYLIFCRGNVEILGEKSVSVVGTRRLSPEGKKAAYSFAYDAVQKGCNVISGLANGADGYAHQGAVGAYFDRMEAGKDTVSLGKTIAVLPSSIDVILPAGHKNLAAQILQSGGCLISEYEPGLPMATWHYVGRNRIIAGMSPATVVIEAPAGSGALITADFALEYNRDVMFHSAAFNDLAKTVALNVQSQLEKDFATGRVSKYKLENCPEKFLEAGAPIIKNYDDYCACLLESPGKRNIVQQGLLFEE